MKRGKRFKSLFYILIHALKHEPLPLILKNIWRSIFQKESPYHLYHRNQLLLQFTRIYLTPARVELHGWAFHSIHQIERIVLEDFPNLPFQYGIRDKEVQKKFSLPFPEVAFHFVGPLPLVKGNRIKMVIHFQDDHQDIISFNVPIPKYPAKTEFEKILGPLYALPGLSFDTKKLVSIIIPFRDKVYLLQQVLESVFRYTTKNKIEIILLNNGSQEESTLRYIQGIKEKHNFIQVVSEDTPFNYSRLINKGADAAQGEFLIFMNNDIEVCSENWLQKLGLVAADPQVGICGPLLLYPDKVVQHAGIILTSTNPMYAWKLFPIRDQGHYLHRAREFSAITGACTMMRKNVFQEIGGFDEQLAVTLNDVDLCQKIREQGYKVILYPEVQMIHHESISRGRYDAQENDDRTRREKQYFQRKWIRYLKKGDPFYSKKLSQKYPDYRFAE